MDKDAHDKGRVVKGLKEVLLSLEGHQDAVLIEYIMVLMGSGKGEGVVTQELHAFMSSREHTERLVRWLFDNYYPSLDTAAAAHGTLGTWRPQPQQSQSQQSIKSVVSIASGAAVCKSTTAKTAKSHGILKSVIDGVIKSNNSSGSGDSNQNITVRDARDIINCRRRSTDDTVSVNNNNNNPLKTTTQHGDARMEPIMVKKTVKCPDYPNCRKSDQECPMVHPQELCKYFPNCLFGKDCLFIHPPVPCRFGDRCQNAVCNFTHSTPSVSVPLSTDSPATTTTTTTTTLTIPCKFNDRCRRPNCPFLHTVAMPCPHGAQCMRPACPFTHPIDHAQPAPRAMVNRPCRYGRACAKADCPFQHPKQQAQPGASDGNEENVVTNLVVPPNKEP